MADVAHFYDKAGVHLVKNDWAWKVGVSTVYMALFTSSYTPNQASDETYGALTGELPTALGYTQGGAQMTLADPTVVGTDPQAYTRLSSSDVSWTGTFSGVKTIVIYNNTGSKYVIGFMEYDTAKLAQGNNFTVQCPTTGWFNMATP